MRQTAVFFIALTVLLAGLGFLEAGDPLPAEPEVAPAAKERVRVSDDRRGFALEPSRAPFVPWGFNYDHDTDGRLIEEYWDAEWTSVEEDFREMKQLGANVVRIHLQTGRFIRLVPGATSGDGQRDGVPPAGPPRVEAIPEALARLGHLLRLAESLGLYLDLTGLGCYLKKDIPPGFDALGETERWDVQARFWEIIAERCAASPSVFSYDLMNEPVVSGGPRSAGDWLGPPFAEKYHYVQFIALDPAGRVRSAVAKAWTRKMAQAVRSRDPRRLVTVGLVDWSLDRPGLTSGFVPTEVAPEVDFLAVHLYPESVKVEEALRTLEGFAVGCPVVIEETFPLRCSLGEMRTFLDGSRRHTSGWISFYWGKTPEECRRTGSFQDAVIAAWLDEFLAFKAGRPAGTPPASKP
jgi:hypothetical protein